MSYSLTGKRERFCQLVAAEETYTEAYLQAFQKPPEYDRKLAAEAGSRLMSETSVKLRVQELRAPVIRKVRRKIEYNTQRALEQCETALDLATESGDAKTILKAVEMQARLTKLLTEEVNVNHRYGVLDDASTETLLLMKRDADIRRARQKLLAASIVVECETKPDAPLPPLVEQG